MRRLTLSLLAFVSLCTTASAMMLPTSSSSAASLVPLAFNVVNGNIAYLRMGPFTADTAKRIRITMQQIATMHPRGVIIDLRSNPGGEIGTVQGLMESILPQGTPYMREILPGVRTLAVTANPMLLKSSIPIVALRDARTNNEADIVVYMIKKLRKGAVIEFSATRNALSKTFKSDTRMSQYLPIKESSFYVVPDDRIIGNEGASQDDVLPAAVAFVKQLSPWGGTK